MISEHSKKPLYETGIDTTEFIENRELTQALEMLKRIIEDLNPEAFSLEEIQHEFNAMTSISNPDTARVRFGPSHIETLLEDGLIEKSTDEEQHYHVTQAGMNWYEQLPEDAGMEELEESA